MEHTFLCLHDTKAQKHVHFLHLVLTDLNGNKHAIGIEIIG